MALTGLHIQQGRISAFVSRAGFLAPGAEISSYFRIPVFLNEAYPELTADCEKTPVRLRAARLRSLASVGLNALAASSVAAPAQAYVIPAKAADATQRHEDQVSSVAVSHTHIDRADAVTDATVEASTQDPVTPPSAVHVIDAGDEVKLIKPSRRLSMLAKSLVG